MKKWFFKLFESLHETTRVRIMEMASACLVGPDTVPLRVIEMFFPTMRLDKLRLDLGYQREQHELCFAEASKREGRIEQLDGQLFTLVRCGHKPGINQRIRILKTKIRSLEKDAGIWRREGLRRHALAEKLQARVLNLECRLTIV